MLHAYAGSFTASVGDWFLLVGAEAITRKDLDPVKARDRLQILFFILTGFATSGLQSKFGRL